MVRPKSVSYDANRVTIAWSDGHESVFVNKHLREACPCALCRGEANPFGLSHAIPLLSEISSDVKPTRHRMVGLYAISFQWSDGHDTGIYPYDYLLQICVCERCAGKK